MMTKILLVPVVILICLLATAVVRAGEPTTIEPIEKWADVFSGSEVKFHYAVRTTEPLEDQLNWSLSVNRRTVRHGQVPLRTGPEKATEVAVPLRVPEVKEGVILEARLSIAAYSADSHKPVAEHVRKVWIYPRDPFVDRSEWLKGLKITLFDPDEKTAEVLNKARVPFTFVKDISALDDLSAGLLVIGEGTAWKDHRLLGETMVKAAARGVPVLCLAPGEGAIPLAGAEGSNLPPPKSLMLRQEDIIPELDKRLDATPWPPEGRIAASRIAIKSDRDQVVAEVSQAARAWPWLEMRYPAPKGRLLVCGFGIIRHWEATPAPRYLLSELFQRLTAANQSTPLPQAERED